MSQELAHINPEGGMQAEGGPTPDAGTSFYEHSLRPERCIENFQPVEKIAYVNATHAGRGSEALRSRSEIFRLVAGEGWGCGTIPAKTAAMQCAMHMNVHRTPPRMAKGK